MTGYIFLTSNYSIGGSERERKQRSTQRILQKSSIHCRLGKCRPCYRGSCRPSPSARSHGFKRNRVHRRRCLEWYVIFCNLRINCFFVLLKHNYRFVSSQYSINILWGTHNGNLLDIPVDRSDCGASRRDSGCWCINGFGRWSFVFYQNAARRGG